MQLGWACTDIWRFRSSLRSSAWHKMVCTAPLETASIVVCLFVCLLHDAIYCNWLFWMMASCEIISIWITTSQVLDLRCMLPSLQWKLLKPSTSHWSVWYHLNACQWPAAAHLPNGNTALDARSHANLQNSVALAHTTHCLNVAKGVPGGGGRHIACAIIGKQNGALSEQEQRCWIRRTGYYEAALLATKVVHFVCTCACIHCQEQDCL